MATTPTKKKKKQKLNVKFLAIAGGVVLVGAVGWVSRPYLYKVVPQLHWAFRGSPTQHAAKGKALFDQGKYDEAAEEYKTAIALKGSPDAPMFTALGECYSHLILKDNENSRRAVTFWEQALVVNPTYMPALEKLLDLYEDNAETQRGASAAQWWAMVHDKASTIVATDPTNLTAQIALQRSVIMRWLSGVETSPADIDAAIAALQQDADQKPFHAEALLYIAIAKANRAVAQYKMNDTAGASAILDDIQKMVDDGLAAHPDDANMHFRAGFVLAQIGQIGRAPGQAPKYIDRVRAELDKAVELVKPDDPNYVDIKISVARIVETFGERDRALKMYQSLLAERPDELQARVALGESLNRDDATRLDAIKLLSEAPQIDSKNVSGLKAMMWQSLDRTRLFDLITAKLDILSKVGDQQQSDALLKQIDDDYAKFSANPGVSDSPAGLQLRGRIEMAKRQYIAAVQTLKRALDLMGGGAGGNINELEQRRRTMLVLAQAYLSTEQSGEAMKTIQAVLQENPGLYPARQLYVQLLIRDGNIPLARQNLDTLMQTQADDPINIRLYMTTLDKDKDKDKLAELYAKLPEQTPQQMLDKARMAIFCGRKEDAAKLYESIHAAVPNNIGIQADLARLYLDIGDKTRAKATIDDVVAKNPNRPDLLLLQTQIAGGDVQEEKAKLIAGLDDPLEKELLQHDLARSQGKIDEARQHLANAIKIKPDDGRVLELQFNYALTDHQWDKAASLMEALAKMNRDRANGMLFHVRYDMARGMLDAASDEATDLTKKLPEFSQSYVILGQVRQAQHKYSEALLNFDQAIQKQPDNYDAIQGLIATSYSLNRPNDVRRYIDMGRRLFPNNVVLREQDLDHELKYGNPENVIAPRQQMLTKAIDSKDPKESAAWLAMGNTYMAVAKSKTNPNDAKPFYEKARDTFRDASAKFQDDPAFVELLADACLQLHDPAEGEKAIVALRDRPAWQNKPEPTVMLARYYARAGKSVDEQEKVLQDFLASSPAAVPAQVQLASLLAKQNKLDDAMKVLSPNADDPTIRRQRIELQINAGHLPEAEKEIQAALALTSNPDPILLNRQAYVYMRSGRATEALQILEKVLAQDPSNTEALSYRATIYVAAQKNLDQAIRDLLTVRDTPGAEMSSRLMLAQAYHYKGDDEQATAELEDTVKAFPAEKTPRLRLVDYYMRAVPPRFSPAERTLADARSQPSMANDTDIMQAEANMWIKRNDPTKAIAAIQQAMKLAPSDLNLFHTYCDAMLAGKMYRPILTSTDPMVKAKKAPWWVFDYRGRAQKALGEKQLALDEFSAGMSVALDAKDDGGVATIVSTIADQIGVGPAKLRIEPMADKGDNRWRLMLAQLCQTDNDLPGAIDWAQKVMDDPNVTPDALDVARTTAASFYLRMNPPDTKKAVDLYKKLLERNPNNVVALNNLACAMILPDSGFKAQDALPYSEKAYKVIEQTGTVDPYIYDTQGYVLVLAGRTTEGINLLQKAIDKQPLAESCYHLGEAYMSLPQPQTSSAQEVFKQAQALLDAASRDQKPLDADLKDKIDKALAQAQQAGSTTAPSKPTG